MFLVADYAHRIEQRCSRFRTRPQVRLPSLQGRRSPGVGRPPEQARWQVVLPVQG